MPMIKQLHVLLSVKMVPISITKQYKVLKSKQAPPMSPRGARTTHANDKTLHSIGNELCRPMSTNRWDLLAT